MTAWNLFSALSITNKTQKVLNWTSCLPEYNAKASNIRSQKPFDLRSRHNTKFNLHFLKFSPKPQYHFKMYFLKKHAFFFYK